MKFVVIVTFIFALNSLLFMANYSMLQINPDTPTLIYQYEGSPIQDLDSGGFIINETTNIPTVQTSADVGGNFNAFTDLFSTIRGWLLSNPIMNFAYNVLFAFGNLLKVAGVPTAICFALQVIWYVATTFALINWLKGWE